MVVNRLILTYPCATFTMSSSCEPGPEELFASCYGMYYSAKTCQECQAKLQNCSRDRTELRSNRSVKRLAVMLLQPFCWSIGRPVDHLAEPFTELCNATYSEQQADPITSRPIGYPTGRIPVGQQLSRSTSRNSLKKRQANID